MPFCPQCGTNNPEGYKFCSSCGAPAAGAAPGAMGAPVVEKLVVDVPAALPAEPAPQRWIIDATQLGKGGYGKVYAAQDTATGATVAAKVIPCERMKPEAIAQELALLRMLEHPNIIGYVGAEQKGEHYFIYMELAAGGELFSRVVRSEAGFLTEEKARPYFTQIIAAVRARAHPPPPRSAPHPSHSGTRRPPRVRALVPVDSTRPWSRGARWGTCTRSAWCTAT